MQSKHFIGGGGKLHHNKHVQHSLGEHTQAGSSNDTMNDDIERTTEGMCLCLVTGMSDGHDFVNLNTGKLMNGQTIKWKKLKASLKLNSMTRNWN